MPKKLPYSQALIARLTTLTKRIMESTVQFMSPDEQERGPFLTEPEFLARVEAFIKDPENRIATDEETKTYVMGLLAKIYYKGIQAQVVRKYMLQIPPPPAARKGTARAPLKAAAKKRKVEQIRKQLTKRKKT